MHILMLLLLTLTSHFFLYSSTTSLHEPSDPNISQTPHPTYPIFLNLPYPPLSTRFQSIIQLLLSFMPPVIYVVSRVCDVNVFMPHPHFDTIFVETDADMPGMPGINICALMDWLSCQWQSWWEHGDVGCWMRLQYQWLSTFGGHPYWHCY